MSNQEQILSGFQQYAREIINEHSKDIREKYKNGISGEVRLSVFNQHLDALKSELLNKMRELSVQYKNETGADEKLITGRLHTQYDNYINEFFKTEF